MIHFFGCSLTYGSEISGVDVEHPDPDDVQYTWPIVLSKKLNFTDDQIKVWARPGATCRDIALTTIDAMHKHDGIFVVGWTWPERTNYWNPDMDINVNQPGLTVTPAYLGKPVDKTHAVLKHPELINHYVTFDSYRNWVINFLTNFQLVTMTAELLKKQCIHIQFGGTIEFLNIEDWFSIQVIPHEFYTKKRLEHLNNQYLMYMQPLIEHTMYKNWVKHDVLFKNDPLWEYVYQMVNNNRKYYNGTHWSRDGCALVADILYDHFAKVLKHT